MRAVSRFFLEEWMSGVRRAEEIHVFLFAKIHSTPVARSRPHFGDIFSKLRAVRATLSNGLGECDVRLWWQ